MTSDRRIASIEREPIETVLVRTLTRLTVLVASVLGLAACAPLPPGSSRQGLHEDGGTSGDGSASCSSAHEGCPCDEDPPRDCYLEPTIQPSGEMTCHAGTRYCRAGAWTTCESIVDYTIESTSAPLITGPSVCNPCDPRCFVTRDTPTGGDLTPTTSTSTATYDPMRGGIVITSSTTGMPAPSADDDRDGVPNAADGCVGPGTAAGCCEGAVTTIGAPCDSSTFLFHALNQGGPPVSDRLPITYAVRSADVYFLMDTTGSMGGELARLRTDLTTGTFTAGCPGGVIGAIQCAIPNAAFGVGYHDDYPFCPDGRCYGWTPDQVYQNLQDLTLTTSAAQTAINSLVIHNGADGPESQLPAIWAIASGGGLGTYLAPRTGCAAGTTFGYPCFRTNSIPIIIHISDAPYHNGPGDAYPYCLGTPSGAALPAATAVTGNERMATTGVGSAYNIGNVNARWVSFSGSTTTLADNHAFTCGAATAGARDAVFRFQLSAPQTTTITLEGSSYDTMLYVVPVAGGTAYCNDDAVGLASRLVVALPAGDYYVVVDGYGAATGSYRLTVGVSPPPGCTGAPHYPPTFAETAAAMNARGARIITMQTCGNWSDPYCLEGERHAIALGRATGSTTPTPPTATRTTDAYVFRGAADGSGLSSAIVNAVVDLANYSRTNLTARPVGDTWNFVRSISSFRWGPAGNCSAPTSGTGTCWTLASPATTSDCFVQCTPGTDVRFDVVLQNVSAPPGVYAFFIDIIANPGNVVVQRVPVRIIVPGRATTYAPSASYWRDYDSTLSCSIDEAPAWGQLTWTVDIPAGTSVRFDLRTSDTLAGLPTATPVASVTTTTTGAGSADIANLLTAAGARESLPYLRVTATLFASPDLLRSPALSAMSVNYTCVPNF